MVMKYRLNTGRMLIFLSFLFLVNIKLSSQTLQGNSHQIGLKFYNSGKYELAVERFDKAIGQSSPNAELYFDRAMALIELERFDDALNDLKITINLSRNHLSAYINIGYVYIRLEQYQNAILELDKALAIDEKCDKALYNRGLAYYLFEEYIKAKDDFEELLSINSNFDRLYELIESCEALMKPPRAWAIAVGIGQYRLREMTELRSPARHAIEFAEFLRENGVVDYRATDIPILINDRAKRDDIKKVMTNVFLSDSVGGNDIIFFYFSGHGSIRDSSSIICPYDYEFENDKFITEREIYDIMNESKAKHKICFVETCRTEHRYFSAYENPAIINEERKKHNGGIAYFYSSDTKEYSQEYDNIGGIFSYFLFKGVNGEANTDSDKKYISTEELYEYLYERVSEYTDEKQNPQINIGYPNIPLFYSNK